MAVLSVPVVRLKRASVPSAALPFAYPPSGVGLTAKTFGGGERAKYKSTRAAVIKSKPRLPRCRDDWFVVLLGATFCLLIVEHHLQRWFG